MKPSIKWLGIAGTGAIVLLAGLVLSPGAYLGLVALLFLLAATVLASSVLLTAPFLGLALLLVTAVAFPVEFHGPAGVMMSSSLPIATFLCAIWILRVALTREFSVDGGVRVVYALLAFMVSVGLAFAAGQFPWFPSDGAPLPAQLAEVGIFVVSGCLFLAVAYQIRSIIELKLLVGLFVIAGLFTCLLQMQLHPALSVIARLTTRPGSVGSLFWTWLVAVSFSQALANRNLTPPVRMFLCAVTALVMYHGLFNARSWASGWIPPLAAIGTILLVKFPRLSIGSALVAVPTALLLRGFLSDAILGGEQYSLMTRQEAWRVLWQLVERSPVLGTGPANYYYYTENLPILGWYVRFISHNNYQDLIIQTGLLGLLTFCWLALEMFLLTIRVYRKAPEGFPKAYAIGALGGLVGSLLSGMLGDWIIPFYYNAGILGFRSSLLFWVFLGGVLALKRMIAWPVAVEDIAPGQAWSIVHTRDTLARAH